MAASEVQCTGVKEELKEHKKGETPTPERPSASSTPDSLSSDDMCSICLGCITDRCVTDSCLHGFCLLCLKEWAKQKAVCPLCKLNFTKIMYDIKGETEYKEWKVPQPEPQERSHANTYFQDFLDAERRIFFGYRTTPFPGASRLRALSDLNRRSATVLDAIPSLPPNRRARYSVRESNLFRLSVYLNNLWIQPLADITGRYRQTSPELYREQPALTHRLVPWVNREIAAMLPPSRVGLVLTEVMDLIERHPINSREFLIAVQPHFGNNSRHFIHEFYHFARSPYDMVGHDNAAQYVPRYENEYVSSNSSSEDSDAVVEVDAVGNPVASTSSTDGSRGQLGPGNVVREETLTQGGSVVISSSSSSSDSSDGEDTQPSRARISSNNFDVTSNPEPPSTMRRLLDRAYNFLSTVNDGASTSRPRNQEDDNSGKASAKLPTNYDDDSDGCFIIEEVVPKVPTPEIIELDSDDENSEIIKQDDNSVNEDISSKKRRKVSGKSKPSLKRTNILPIPASNDASDVECTIARQDHSYCTEDSSMRALPSSSGTQVKTPASIQTNFRKDNYTKTRSDVYGMCDTSFSSFSDSDICDIANDIINSNRMNRSSISHPSTSKGSKEKSSRKEKRKHSDRSYSSSLEKPRKQKYSEEDTLLVKIPRKDLKCKIKSSLSHSHSSSRSGSGHRRHSYHREYAVESSNSSNGAWDSSVLSRKTKQNELRPSCSRGPSSYRREKYPVSVSDNKHRSSSLSSCDELRVKSKSSRHDEKLRKLKKSLKKRKRRHKEKHRNKSKKSSKTRKHTKSKTKRYTSSDSENESRRPRKKSCKKKELSISDSSDSSYIQYKRHTTVRLRIGDSSSSSSIED
ncbi:hypothetical protein SK128_025710 [Halocaridina rubra]|uniref:RING-type E3 ubiquitin transferase n=1 Tax=Halocaridina rubra TaxID=373956 RepID=A0AAN8XCS3_HALRR